MKAGEIIGGKYRLHEVIGTGGMATVWDGTHLFTERRCAIKCLHPEVARNAEAAARFLVEAKVPSRIDHPNVIEVMDVGQTDDGTLFLVMELLSGRSLEAALRARSPAMTAHDLVLVLVDVARALAAAHTAGVVHRDLKPTNIFLHTDRDGVQVPKVLDFGVSKILEDPGVHGLTVAGTVLGSPLYMSPEQASGAATIDGRSDVFSFGAVLFEALTGRRPYEAPNFNALLVTIATTAPRSIDEAAPHLPEALRAVVRGCLERDLSRRLSRFDAIADALEGALPALESRRAPLPPLASPAARATSAPPPWGPWSTLAPARPRGPSGVGVMGVAAAAAAALVLSVAGAYAVLARGRASAASAAPSADVAATPEAPSHLSVTASPGACDVWVDDVPRGQTPAEGLELAGGAHRLECRPERGAVRKAVVVLPRGGAARYTFALDP